MVFEFAAQHREGLHQARNVLLRPHGAGVQDERPANRVALQHLLLMCRIDVIAGEGRIRRAVNGADAVGEIGSTASRSRRVELETAITRAARKAPRR